MDGAFSQFSPRRKSAPSSMPGRRSTTPFRLPAATASFALEEPLKAIRGPLSAIMLKNGISTLSDPLSGRRVASPQRLG